MASESQEPTTRLEYSLKINNHLLEKFTPNPKQTQGKLYTISSNKQQSVVCKYHQRIKDAVYPQPSRKNGKCFCEASGKK